MKNLQNLLTRRKFLIGTAGLALSSVLPACSQKAKTVQTQPTEPEISSVTDHRAVMMTIVSTAQQRDHVVIATAGFRWR